MRIPIRSETEAFRLTVAAVVAIVVSGLIGWLVDPLAGVLVFAAAFVVGLVLYLRAPNPDHMTPLRAAARGPHIQAGPPGKRHLLVVANEPLSGSELRTLIAESGEGAEVDILAPVLTSHMHYNVSDIDHELAAARTRLAQSMAWAREQGLEARGSVGDPSPTTALEDELRAFGADEVIVVTHERERETWQERDELDRLREELDVPVTHLTVNAA